MIELNNVEKAFETRAGQTFVLRRINLDDRGGRVRHDHGAVGRRQVHAPLDPRHARPRLDGRVPAARARRPPAEAEGAHRAEQEVRRVRLPAVPPARQPDGRREPRHPALLPQRQGLRARGDRRRHARPLPDRRQEGPLPEPALRRPAAARRRGARAHREAEAPARRRADRQPPLRPGARDHAPLPEAERRGHDDRPGHALRGERAATATGSCGCATAGSRARREWPTGSVRTPEPRCNADLGRTDPEGFQ